MHRSQIYGLKNFLRLFYTLLFRDPYHGTKLTVKGLQKIPKHVDVPVKVCNDPDNFRYPKGLLCAGEPQHDSCQGDSGGPLMNIINENGQSKYEWIGKVSFASEQKLNGTHVLMHVQVLSVSE